MTNVPSQPLQLMSNERLLRFLQATPEQQAEIDHIFEAHAETQPASSAAKGAEGFAATCRHKSNCRMKGVGSLIPENYTRTNESEAVPTSNPSDVMLTKKELSKSTEEHDMNPENSPSPLT